MVPFPTSFFLNSESLHATTHQYLDGTQEPPTRERFIEQFRSSKKRVYMDLEVAAANIKKGEKRICGDSHVTLPGIDTPSLKYIESRFIFTLLCFAFFIFAQTFALAEWTLEQLADR